MIIAFCGHRNFQRSEEIRARLFAFLETQIGDRPAELFLGGYGAFDSFAFECGRNFRAEHPHTSLVFVTPYLDETYQQRRLSAVRDGYDSVLYPELERIPRKFAIAHRNRFMVDRADWIVAYVCGEVGGAYATYRYAKQRGKPILNLASPDGD